MTIQNPPPLDRIQANASQIVRLYVKQIGAWNMDANATKNVVIVTPADYSRTLGYSVLIYTDGAPPGLTLPLDYADPAAAYAIAGEVESEMMGDFSLARRAGGIFDSATYDDPGVNRGYILWWYLTT